HIHDPHREALEPPLKKSGRDTDRAADTKREADREPAIDERGPGAEEDTRKDVASELMGAEPMRGAWPFEPGRDALNQGVVRGNPGREKRKRKRDRDHEDGQGKDTVMEKFQALSASGADRCSRRSGRSRNSTGRSRS